MLELNVEGMSCGHCVGRVTRAIQELDPGAKVEVNLAAKKVRVESQAAPQAVAEAVTEAGYPATAQA
ncbi:MAG: heavy-metal-associated domain-containing protein [Telluria sp.]